MVPGAEGHGVLSPNKEKHHGITLQGLRSNSNLNLMKTTNKSYSTVGDATSDQDNAFMKGNDVKDAVVGRSKSSGLGFTMMLEQGQRCGPWQRLQKGNGTHGCRRCQYRQAEQGFRLGHNLSNPMPLGRLRGGGSRDTGRGRQSQGGEQRPPRKPTPDVTRRASHRSGSRGSEA
uniref:Uncharacterized protein n=1 Tax=Aegilops tauschii subsp. strangulata TaxID=200361 RepID=A0A452Y5H2_AEGTS